MHRSLILVGACIAAVASPRAVAAQSPPDATILVQAVTEKLGVKAAPSAPRQLDLGQSATGTLDEPRKLAPFGVTTLHEGARVTITCVAPGRLRVEVEEMEPVEARAIFTLHVAEDGSMTKVPERAPAKSPSS